MYPDRELIRLAAHKAALQGHIRRHRAQCAASAARVAQPLAWLDRVVAFWRRLPPLAQFAAGPLAGLVQRSFFPRQKLLGSLLRWGPLAFGALRGLGAGVRPSGAPHRPASRPRG